MRFLPILFLLAIVACDSEQKEVTQPTQPVEKTKQVEELVEEDVLDGVPDRVFGLPVPDRITHHRKFAGSTRLMTKNDLETVHKFFTTQLVDYEIVEVGRGYIAVGLHPYQSQVEYRRKGRLQYPVELVYRKGAPKKTEIAAKTPIRVKGTPVDLKTKNGDLLAPGARWGEPYTPPVNSPLNKKKFRSNFGKPFGTWVEQ